MSTGIQNDDADPWDNVWEERGRLAFQREVHNPNPVFSKALRNCDCYDYNCAKAKTFSAYYGRVEQNLFSNPVNPQRENRELDSKLEIEPPEIEQDDVFLFRRHPEAQNFVTIEKLLFSKDKETEEYVKSLECLRELLQQQVKKLFEEEIGNYKKTNRVFSKRYGKRLGELYAGRPVGYFYKRNGETVYGRGSLTNVRIEKKDHEILDWDVHARTISIVNQDDHHKFIHNIPFGHFLYLDGCDKELISCSKTKNILVSNVENLPFSKYFVGRIDSREFDDIFGRPSYSLAIIDWMQCRNATEIQKNYDMRRFICPTASFVYHPDTAAKSTGQQIIKVPHQIFNQTCKLHMHTYTIEDVQVQNNRAGVGMQLNENFPYKQNMSSGFGKYDNVTIFKQTEPHRAITFKTDRVRRAFDKLFLEFRYISTGANVGWTVQSSLDPNSFSSVLVEEGAMLTEVHRKYLVFKQMNGINVIIDTSGENLL